MLVTVADNTKIDFLEHFSDKKFGEKFNSGLDWRYKSTWQCWLERGGGGGPPNFSISWGFLNFLINYGVDTSHGAVADPGRCERHVHPLTCLSPIYFSFSYFLQQKL